MRTRKSVFLPVLLLVLAAPATADDRDLRIRDLESEVAYLQKRVDLLELHLSEQRRQIDRLEVRLERLEDGGTRPPPPPMTITSEVDVRCVQDRFEKFPYQPSFENVVSWLVECRNRPMEEPGCLLVEQEHDAACFDKAVEVFPYQPSSENLEIFSHKCKRVTLSCTR